MFPCEADGAGDDCGHAPSDLPKEHVPTSLPRIPQLPYRNKFAMSFEANLAEGEFVLVPSTKTVGGPRSTKSMLHTQQWCS